MGHHSGSPAGYPDEDPKWAQLSEAALAEARDAGGIVINLVVYAEVSVRFERIEMLDEALPAADFLCEELPYPAGFLAGKAYARYRRPGGVKRAPLADSYIGAHAAVCRYALLTRDAGPVPAAALAAPPRLRRKLARSWEVLAPLGAASLQDLPFIP